MQIIRGDEMAARYSKEVNLLTYWADVKVNGDEALSGYASESNLCILQANGGGRAGSRALWSGRMGQSIEMAVDQALGSVLSEFGQLCVVAMYAPNKSLTMRDRIELTGVDTKRFYQIQQIALQAVRYI